MENLTLNGVFYIMNEGFVAVNGIFRAACGLSRAMNETLRVRAALRSPLQGENALCKTSNPGWRAQDALPWAILFHTFSVKTKMEIRVSSSMLRL